MKRFSRLIILMLVLTILGIIFIVGGVKRKVALNNIVDIAEVEQSELKSSMIVEGTIYEIWDEFAYMEEEDTHKVKYCYYAFPLESSFNKDELVFLALELRDNADRKIANKMVKESDDYYAEGSESDLYTTFEILGRVSKLKGDGLEFFEDYIDDLGGDSDNYIPLVISPYTVGNENQNIIIGAIMAAIGIGGISLFVVLLLKKRG